MQLHAGPRLSDDREFADVLREVNELRRSRSLPEYQPTTVVRLHPRRPSRWAGGACWARLVRR